MSIIGEIIAVILVIGLLLGFFLKASPSALAATLRISGPVSAAICGLALVAIGRAGLGGMLVAAGLAWGCTMLLARRKQKPERRRAMVRTAALEMQLDHDTGVLEGLVLAGRSEGRTLGRMSQAELVALYRELAADSESRQLLEAYLDSRFPVWRKSAKANGGRRLRGAPGPGPMTKEEAYKILGLEAGAAAADIRKAHRRLMQRLHPDVSSTSFLAARINEAKDVLLSDHN